MKWKVIFIYILILFKYAEIISFFYFIFIISLYKIVEKEKKRIVNYKEKRTKQ